MLFNNQSTCFNIKNPYHLLATFFGIGFFKIPGTIGSLFTIPLWYMTNYWIEKNNLFIILFLLLFIIYICHRTSLDIKVKDHSSIVLDEFIGMWITLTMLESNNIFKLCLCFLFFRFFDILKPWPICWIHKNVSGGLGIVMDDVCAGILSGFSIYILCKII